MGYDANRMFLEAAGREWQLLNALVCKKGCQRRAFCKKRPQLIKKHPGKNRVHEKAGGEHDTDTK